ncbi:MAG: C_GCAxxG_C_C family protein [Bacteroidaceae bacterium]|nr:C_GCAxxG_C_C family protein [Bacteroidaceae bacterium]
MEISKEDRIQRAVELFMQGYGCCQSVVCAFSDLYGLDEEMALRVSAGFGGGVGRMRMMCGSCSALVILAGLERGQTRGEDREGKAACYQLVRQLLETFRQRNGSIICAELLQRKTPQPPLGGEPKFDGGSQLNTLEPCMPDERNAEYYRVRPCARKVESAARVFAEYLASSETSRKEGKSLA